MLDVKSIDRRNAAWGRSDCLMYYLVALADYYFIIRVVKLNQEEGEPPS